MNYNERTGTFGKPKYYRYGNHPALFTHFDGITAVPGGFNLVAISSAQAASLALIPVSTRHGSFGRARWYPINVTTSSLCPGGCSDGALYPKGCHSPWNLPRHHRRAVTTPGPMMARSFLVHRRITQ
jgi:hypothetical protein